MSGDEPGYSASREELDRLPFETPSASQAGAAANLLARQYLDAHPEPEMDKRFFRNAADVHRDEVLGALRAAGYEEYTPGATARAADSVRLGADIPAAVNALVFQQRQSGPPAARSADRLVQNYRARR